jgi:hypothetical protein
LWEERERRRFLQPGLRSFAVGAYIVLYRIDGDDVLIRRVAGSLDSLRTDRQDSHSATRFVYGDDRAFLQLRFVGSDDRDDHRSDVFWEYVVGANLNDAGTLARVSASSVPKSKSCVKTTCPFSRAHAMIVRSFARGSPTVDQCTACQP